MIHKKFKLIFLFNIAISHCSFSQINLNLHFNNSCIDSSTINLPKKKYYNNEEIDKSLIFILEQFYNKGYLLANYDTVIYDSLNVSAYLSCNQIFKWGYLKQGNVSEKILEKSNVKLKKISDKPFSIDEVNKIKKRIIRYYENNGHPFATIHLDSIEIVDTQFYASLKTVPSDYIVFDSIINKGNLELKPAVLHSIINIFPDDMYNEAKLNDINTNIGRYRFIRIKESHKVEIHGDKAKLFLYFDKRKSNSFDGIIGFMPDYRNEGKLFITGDLNFQLNNSLNYGEDMKIRWRQIEQQSQDLKIHANVPHLLFLPFGTIFDFTLFKKDTTFITTETKFSFNHLLKKNEIKLFLNFFNSSLLSTSGYENLNKLPDFADIKINSIGIEFSRIATDNIFNPRKGHVFNTGISVGKKNIIKNHKIPEHLYENLNLDDTYIKTTGRVELYINFNNATFLLQNASGYIKTSSYFDNELFRFGGLNTMRGFDENFFTAHFFSVQTLEARWLLDEYSYLCIFSDFGYLERKVQSDFLIQRPLGVGAGFNIGGESNMFSLFYAVGRTDTMPFEIRAAKIHFGYKSFF